ncbi:MAG: hypothetical protein ACRC4T_01515 [Cetobacterium sp.]
MTKSEIITAIISFVNLAFVFYIAFFGEKNKKRLENKSYWFKKHILRNDLNDFYNIIKKIIEILDKKKSITRREFASETKDQVQNLRDYFEIVYYIDRDMSKKIKSFIGLFEGEVIQNDKLEKEDILIVKRVLISSIYNYEMNGYKDFTIDYSRSKDE